MKLYELKRTQVIPAPIDLVWDFFSTPENLKIITPPFMGFIVTSGSIKAKMYEGQIISYIVKPLMGIPITWVTEITHMKNLEYFIDEQRFGPYKFWHHEHFFKQTSNNVEMTDIVKYALPAGPFGEIIHEVIVKNKLQKIFEFRFKKTRELFLPKSN